MEKMRTNVTPDTKTGCLLWNGPYVTRGYGAIYIIGKQWMTHRLAWELHVGPIPYREHVLHRCDVPACINPNHLFTGEHQTNMADMVKKGRHKTARKTRLAHGAVRKIRRDARAPRDIALEHGISAGYVRAIKSGRCLFWIE